MEKINNKLKLGMVKKYGVVASCFLVMAAGMIIASNLVGTSANVTNTAPPPTTVAPSPATPSIPPSVTTSTPPPTTTSTPPPTTVAPSPVTTSTPPPASGSTSTPTTAPTSTSTTGGTSGGGSGTTSSTSTSTSPATSSSTTTISTPSPTTNGSSSSTSSTTTPTTSTTSPSSGSSSTTSTSSSTTSTTPVSGGGAKCGFQPNGAVNFCANNDYCANESKGWCCPNGSQICSDGRCVKDSSECSNSNNNTSTYPSPSPSTDQCPDAVKSKLGRGCHECDKGVFMSDQHDKYILKNDTTYTVIDCKTKPIGSCSSGNMNTGPNTGPDQCPDNIKSKLGRGCHACGGGNKYWFDDNHEKYILRSDTANTVFDCKTKPVGSCTGGNINTGPIDTDCPDAVKNRLGSSCHECTKGVYMNNDHDKYILKNDPKYTVVDCKTKPIGSCSNTKYDYKKDDYKKDDYKKDDYKKDDYKKKDYSSNPCKTDSRYSKSDDGYYYMKSPKYDGNFTDNMYRGPFDENCKPVSKTTPPLKTVPPTKKKDTFNCPTIYKPVCAITKEGNKKTFNNNCQAKNYGAKIIDFYNSCEYKKDKFNNKDDGYYTKDGTRCIDDYKPVCTIMPDGNKKTQDNACKAKAMNLKIVDFYRGCEYKAYDYSKDKKYDDKGNYDYKRDFKRHKEGPDYDYRKDSNWNYDDKGKDFKKFDKNRKEDEKKGLSRWIRDTKRMIKDMSRWDKGKGPGPGGPGFGPAPVKVEMPKKAKSILAKMEAKLKSAEDYYKKGEYEKARDALEDIQDLRDDFEDAMDELHDKLEIEMIKREVKFAEKEMKKVKEKLQPSFKNYKVCMGYADEGLSLIAKVKAALDKKDWDTLDDLKYKKFELEDKVFRDCKSVYNNKADIKSFNEVYIDQKNRGMSQNIIDQISEEVAKKVLANIKSHSNIVNQIFENVTDKSLTKEIAKTFEVAQVIPKKYQQDFFSQKAAILKEIKEMEGLRKKLKEAKTLAMKELNELKAVQDEIATYNFVGSAGTEIKDEVSKFVASADKLSKTEVKAKIVELKQKAKQKITKARYDKFSKGIIGFLDADDNEWFGKYALQAKQLGYVKGTGESGETKLNPGGKTNVAEAVAMFGRVLGEESTGIVLTTIDLPTWAHGGAAALQKKGVNLDKLFNGKKASDKVTRAETAQLLKEVYKLSSGDNSKFPDINKVASDKKEAIGAVNAAGIMTGEGNGNFNPNAPLNRAAMTKVLIKANEQAKVLTK